MEDFHIAGGTRAFFSRLKSMLHLDARTVSGDTMADAIGDAQVYNDDVIRPLERSDRRLGRHRDPLRQPRARRLRDQTAGGRSAIAAAYRAGDRVRQL